MFRREGDPLLALSRIGGRTPVLHMYSRPRAADFLAAQEAFSRERPWFTVRRLDGVSHFPQLEATVETAEGSERIHRAGNGGQSGP